MKHRPPHSTTDQARQLLDLTRALGRACQLQDRSFCSPKDLTPSQWQVLSAVRAGEPLPMGDLARHIHVTRSTATRLVDLLEKNSLLRRKPSREDRRRQELELTAEGLELVAELDEAGRYVQRQVLMGLPAAERRALLEALRKVVEAEETWVERMLPLDGG